jgi:serine protease
VSGAAALVWAKNPTWNNSMVVNQLFATAQDRGTWGRDDFYGYGIVDAAAAVGYQPPPPPFTVTIVGNTEIQASLSCQWSAIVSGGTAPYSYSWTVNGAPAGDNSASLSYENDGSSFTITVTVTDQTGAIVPDDHAVAIVSGSYCQ